MVEEQGLDLGFRAWFSGLSGKGPMLLNLGKLGWATKR